MKKIGFLAVILVLVPLVCLAQGDMQKFLSPATFGGKAVGAGGKVVLSNPVPAQSAPQVTFGAIQYVNGKFIIPITVSGGTFAAARVFMDGLQQGSMVDSAAGGIFRTADLQYGLPFQKAGIHNLQVETQDADGNITRTAVPYEVPPCPEVAAKPLAYQSNGNAGLFQGMVNHPEMVSDAYVVYTDYFGKATLNNWAPNSVPQPKGTFKVDGQVRTSGLLEAYENGFGSPVAQAGWPPIGYFVWVTKMPCGTLVKSDTEFFEGTLSRPQQETTPITLTLLNIDNYGNAQFEVGGDPGPMDGYIIVHGSAGGTAVPWWGWEYLFVDFKPAAAFYLQAGGGMQKFRFTARTFYTGFHYTVTATLFKNNGSGVHNVFGGDSAPVYLEGTQPLFPPPGCPGGCGP